MNNVLAIAHKEIRAYFSSPSPISSSPVRAAVRFFYVAILNWFVQQACRCRWHGPGTMNVTQQMIRPLLLNTTVVLLFVLPMITMRTYAEEKRSGPSNCCSHRRSRTFRSSLASFRRHGPLRRDAGVTLLYVGALFFFGTPSGNPSQPPTSPVVPGRLLHFGGPARLVLTRNQIVAGMMTFGVFLLLWVIDWIGAFAARRSSPS